MDNKKEELTETCLTLADLGGLNTAKGRKYAIKAIQIMEERKQFLKAYELIEERIFPNLSEEGPFDDEKNPSKYDALLWRARIMV